MLWWSYRWLWSYFHCFSSRILALFLTIISILRNFCRRFIWPKLRSWLHNHIEIFEFNKNLSVTMYSLIWNFMKLQSSILILISFDFFAKVPLDNLKCRMNLFIFKETRLPVQKIKNFETKLQDILVLRHELWKYLYKILNLCMNREHKSTKISWM